ncbi:hypothetical protein [Microvirga sesbaniae]|uniref:hypothetical protein n=1 Tax=Microvirga sesbaniae TaxID=681392 RepID=UPI0021C98A01|nr:hypothetical protein [Microvirga sp. HBU67692]
MSDRRIAGQQGPGTPQALTDLVHPLDHGVRVAQGARRGAPQIVLERREIRRHRVDEAHEDAGW